MFIGKITLAILLACSSAFASMSSDYDVSLEMARTKNVDSLTKRINEQYEYVTQYVSDTGDVTPTKAEINSYFSLTDATWKNYDGVAMDFVFDYTNNKLIFSKPLENPSSNYSKIVVDSLINNKHLPTSTTLVQVDKVEVLLSAQFVSFVRKIDDLNTNHSGKVNIQMVQPSETGKFWYKPDGSNGFDILRFNPNLGTWESIGGTTANGRGIDIILKSEEELDLLPAFTGMIATVSDGSAAMGYIYDGEKWVTKSTTGVGGLFNGDATIVDLATTLLEKAGGSIATVSAIEDEFAGVLELTKKDNSKHEGYWVDVANRFVVSGTLRGISTQNWLLNTIGYFKKDDNHVYMLKKMDINGIRWVYLAENLGSIITMFDNIDVSSGGYVFNVEDSKFYKKFGSVWQSVDGTVQATNDSSGRNAFNSLMNGTTYFINFNDCSASSCNGDSSNGFFAGNQIYGLYPFYFSTVGNRKNNLIDAIPRANISESYNNNDIASLVGANLYFKDEDTRGGTCYKRSDGVFITKSGKLIPNAFMVDGKPNLSQHKTCSDSSWNGNFLVLTRKQSAEWSDAPHGVGANVGGVNFTHLLGSGKDFWTNNTSGDGQVSATEIFTGKGRASFPTVTHSINALSLGLCSHDAFCSQANGYENRYTSGGVTSSIDSEFKQWFYSITGTRVNNLLDGRIASEHYADSGAGSHIVNPTNGRRFDNNQIWGTFETLNNWSRSNGRANCVTNLSCINGRLTITSPAERWNKAFNNYKGANVWGDDYRMAFFDSSCGYDGKSAYSGFVSLLDRNLVRFTSCSTTQTNWH